MGDRSVSQGRGGRWGRRVLYWLAVIVVSIALVIALLMLLQSYDGSTVGAVALGGE
jgi:preprotein translocase subunit SecG